MTLTRSNEPETRMAQMGVSCPTYLSSGAHQAYLTPSNEVSLHTKPATTIFCLYYDYRTITSPVRRLYDSLCQNLWMSSSTCWHKENRMHQPGWQTGGLSPVCIACFTRPVYPNSCKLLQLSPLFGSQIGFCTISIVSLLYRYYPHHFPFCHCPNWWHTSLLA